MTRKPIILITGANGEIGHGLIRHFAEQPDTPDIVAFDLRPLDDDVASLVTEVIVGDILDTDVLNDITRRYRLNTIYHLAAILSTTAEQHPKLAHQVNVQGTFNLLELAAKETGTVKFIYPSSIAVYGLPDLTTKTANPAITEEQFVHPSTMYGANKLYCEHLGEFYARRLLDPDTPTGIDFRCVRFPGIISAFTLPSGGTSDYAPEMIHAVVQGLDYECFVRPDTTIPFMTMPDAVFALTQLATVSADRLTHRTYNVTSFSLSASEFANHLQQIYPQVNITYNPTPARQAIVDSWAHGLDDSCARDDWDWSPIYDVDSAFDAYLLPNIEAYYGLQEKVTA